MRATTIDETQLLSRLEALAASSRSSEANGVTRLAWSAEERRDRARLASWAVEDGLVPSSDAVGNLIAELPGTVEGLAPLVTGSHLDTVVDAGPLDGAYGTVSAFALLGALASRGERFRHPVRAVAWANEEGVVAPAFTGSRAAAGESIDLDALGPDGLALHERIATAGGDPLGVAGAAWAEVAGYFELHIEQGPVLDNLGVAIGVVTGITGCAQGWITFAGRASHAGTTPMDLRRDALVAAARTVLAIEAIGRDGAVRVATAGGLRVHPGNTNVVAGRAAVSFDLRSIDDGLTAAALERLGIEVAAIAETTATTVHMDVTSSTPAVDTDPVLRAAIGDAADHHGLSRVDLPSGAGHDAQHVARIGPVGMVFVPSVEGISHNPAEYTKPTDLVAGAGVLLDALRLADRRLDP